MNKILSWNSLLPLSRLTYGVYLVHYVLQDIQTLRTKSVVTTDTFSVVSLSEDHPPRGSGPAWHAGNPPLFLEFIISRARFSLSYLHSFLNQSPPKLIGTNKNNNIIFMYVHIICFSHWVGVFAALKPSSN